MDGITEQFSQAYDQYIDKIYRFVYLKVNSEEIAEDITSKTFIKAWKTYSEPDNKISNLGAFLYKIAGNLVIDYYRQKDKNKTISTDLIAEPIDIKSDIHQMAVFNADVTVVKECLLKLKKDYQDVITLHYLEDMPINRVAELLGRPEGTIRVMLHRGIKDLQNMINEA